MNKIFIITTIVLFGIPIPTYPPLSTDTVKTHGGEGFPGCPRRSAVISHSVFPASHQAIDLWDGAKAMDKSK